MPFVDTSIREQQEKNQRQRAFEKSISDSFTQGLSQGQKSKAANQASESDRNFKQKLLDQEQEFKKSEAEKDRKSKEIIEKIKKGIPTGAGGGTSTPGGGFLRGDTQFTKEFDKVSAKEFQKELESLPKVDNQITEIDGAIGSLIDFENKSFFGTGPVAKFGTSNPIWNKQSEKLDRQFGRINFKQMMATFKGMAKAIDSDAERRAWDMTQANIANRPETNTKILLGMKSLSLKQKAETEAKKDHLLTHRNLRSYQSPIVGKVIAMVDQNGNMQLVDRNQEIQARQQGLMSVDDYAKELIGGETDFNVNNDAVANDLVQQVKQLSREEKINILRGQ